MGQRVLLAIVVRAFRQCWSASRGLGVSASVYVRMAARAMMSSRMRFTLGAKVRLLGFRGLAVNWQVHAGVTRALALAASSLMQPVWKMYHEVRCAFAAPNALSTRATADACMRLAAVPSRLASGLPWRLNVRNGRGELKLSRRVAWRPGFRPSQ